MVSWTVHQDDTNNCSPMLLPERLCSCCAGVFESTESVPASFLLVIEGCQRTVPFTSFVSPICSVLKKTQPIQSCCRVLLGPRR